MLSIKDIKPQRKHLLGQVKGILTHLDDAIESLNRYLMKEIYINIIINLFISKYYIECEFRRVKHSLLYITVEVKKQASLI